MAMPCTSSGSAKSRDSRQDDEASCGSTPSSDPQESAICQGGPGCGLYYEGEYHKWTLCYPSGSTPGTRYYHAASIVGRKMVVVGGDSDRGMLNDVQQLHLTKLSWKVLPSLSKTKAAQQLPLCKGHSLIAWGQRLLLITGETDPPMEHVSVWALDMERKNWSKVEVKGEVPNARSGHSVSRAGSVLILFGGEDAKGRKLNDLHMFDLKSSMWLPLLAMGSIPSPRSKHVAAIYDDRLLLVFGGASKSKHLNDLYALDFEAMEWSRLKTRGAVPAPRADCAGALFNDKWYIAGGEQNGIRCLETITLDVPRMTWSVVAQTIINSPSASQGFSMVLVHKKERSFLVAFGGKRPGIASEIEVLLISKKELLQTQVNGGFIVKEPLVTAAKKALQSIFTSSLSPDLAVISIDPDETALSKRLQEIEKSSTSEDQSKLAGEGTVDNRQSGIVAETSSPLHVVYEKDAKEDDGVSIGRIEVSDSNSSIAEVKANYEKKLLAAFKNTSVLEGQLKAAIASKEDVERSLHTSLKSRQKAEKRLAVALKEKEDLKKKLAVAELAEEESINLSNIVHAENLRLEHDLAYVKAILEDAQKELQTTRGVLCDERSRAFQLQVELFELKQAIQALQSSDNPS